MALNITSSDPLEILSTTKFVVENSKQVKLDFGKLKNITKIVKTRLEKGLDTAEASFKTKSQSIDDDVQLVFIEDCVNFCFWAEKGKKDWQIEWPNGNIVKGGWYNLVTSFQRALEQGKEVLNPTYLFEISIEEVRSIFIGIDDIDIPLLEKRQENLHEAGRVLLDKFNGKFINAIEESGFDAIELATIVFKNFKSYDDTAMYKGRKVNLYKRAQIVPNDLSYLKFMDKRFDFNNIDMLTAFADYKLPQIMRNEGLIVYSKELAEKLIITSLFFRNQRKKSKFVQPLSGE